MEGDFVYLFLKTCLEEESFVRVRTVEGITKNQSHLAGLNRVFRRFVEVEVVEAWGHVEQGVLLSGGQ